MTMVKKTQKYRCAIKMYLYFTCHPVAFPKGNRVTSFLSIFPDIFDILSTTRIQITE